MALSGGAGYLFRGIQAQKEVGLCQNMYIEHLKGDSETLTVLRERIASLQKEVLTHQALTDEERDLTEALLELYSPCDTTGLRDLRDVSAWVRAHSQDLLDAYLDACDKNGEEPMCNGEITQNLPFIFTGNPNDQYFCPTEIPSKYPEWRVSAVTLRNAENGHGAQLAFSDLHFAQDFCQKVGTWTHEQTHANTNLSHSDTLVPDIDPVYGFGRFVTKYCEDQSNTPSPR